MNKFRTSPLWTKYKNEFEQDKIRFSYGENFNTENDQIVRIVSKYKSFDTFIRRLSSFQLRIARFLFRFIVGSKKFNSFGLYLYNSKFSAFKELELDCKEFIELMHTKLGLRFSFTSFKAAYYLYKLSKIKNIPSSGKFIEIGSGGVQFARMFVSQMNSFELVLVDLPEVLAYAMPNLLKSKFAASIYGPKEINDFFKSTDSRKILFIQPDQLEHLNMKFDGAFNIESFGEMYQEVANGYIDILSQKIVKGGFIYLVNRISRCVNIHNPYSLNSHTQFCNYPLTNYIPVVHLIDDFKIVTNQNDVEKLNYLFFGERI